MSAFIHPKPLAVPPKSSRGSIRLKDLCGQSLISLFTWAISLDWFPPDVVLACSLWRLLSFDHRRTLACVPRRDIDVVQASPGTICHFPGVSAEANRMAEMFLQYDGHGMYSMLHLSSRSNRAVEYRV